MRHARAVLAAVVVLFCWPAPAGGKFDPDKVPPEQQANYETFKVRCGKCHALAKPLNTRMSEEGWKTYVKKMQRRPGSGITEQSAQQILAFLAYLEKVRGEE